MDTGSGEFKKISMDELEEQMEKANPKVFKVGEILEIRSSRFRVDKVLRKKMLLKLLPKLNNQNEEDSD